MSKESFVQEAVLICGPHDGARVKSQNGMLFEVIYVMALAASIDAPAAWSTQSSEVFPHEYVLDHAKEHNEEHRYCYRKRHT